MKFSLILTIAAFLTLPSAFAHHSFEAEYDGSKTATLTGIVTKVDWVNPHAYIFINTKDDAGATKEIRFELGPPYALVRGGWKKDTVKIGDRITKRDDEGVLHIGIVTAVDADGGVLDAEEVMA